MNHERCSHKFQYSVIVENMNEHKVVGPIDQVENYEDAWEEVESNLKVKDMTRNQINDTFLFQNRVKVKVVGEVSEK